MEELNLRMSQLAYMFLNAPVLKISGRGKLWDVSIDLHDSKYSVLPCGQVA